MQPIKGKKGAVSALLTAVPLVIAFVVMVVTISIGGNILSGIRSTQTAGTYEYNATTSGLQGINTFSSNTPTVAIVGIAVVLLLMVVSIFGVIRLGRGR